ncbi:recombinase family protein [Polynucleobacter sp. Tro8-14-1]|jgi:DNA invertase Pin-like site-specific DNA recombinase|uniref:recombinase family protein n=1 Tax=Polynucleobacter sp. Tro8-14-1 TaxID=1758383 RepID=UPI001C0B5DA8|nr:recombinase family protein [Polynucleobacter sp. Tro8-14-1]MBU3563659.1 recombinase family protein [Polynucleobacter sp. Tro8-14-1]
MKKTAVYVRVSTSKQDTTNQLMELRDLAKRMNLEIVQEYIDNGISGSKGREERPGLDLLLNHASQRKFEQVLIFDITRLGRSLQNCIETLNYLNSLNVDILIQKQGIDTSTSVGRLTFSLMASLGEYEKNLMRERIVLGINRAKSQGKKLGRPSNMNDGMKNAIKILREKGMGIVSISKQLNCGVGTVYKYI